ncbi:hypothetical protein M3J09_008563 [Ascochyta lentis]
MGKCTTFRRFPSPIFSISRGEREQIRTSRRMQPIGRSSDDVSS